LARDSDVVSVRAMENDVKIAIYIGIECSTHTRKNVGRSTGCDGKNGAKIGGASDVRYVR
jgi:hypothetical protein